MTIGDLIMIESAVERLTEKAKEHEWDWVDVHPFDLRSILSERAELLATVERLETALIQKADEGMLVLEMLAALSPNHAHRYVKEGLAMARQARAALTTGEANHKDKP